MTALLQKTELATPMLNAEWARITQMLVLAEAMRTGDSLDEAFPERFGALNEAVDAAWSAAAPTGEANLFIQVVEGDGYIFSRCLLEQATEKS